MQQFKNPVTLSVPNDMNYLPMILNFTADVCALTGFTMKETDEVRLGVEEAVTNVIRHSFEPGEQASFELAFEPINLGLRVVIREKGIPFDPESVPEYSREKLKATLDDAGLGLFLMKREMDEVSFHNLGRGGKEAHLTKYIKDQHIQERMTPFERAQAEREKEEEPKPPVEFEVRPMKPVEAVDVARCAYSSYRYSYIYEHVYYPERFRELNRQGKVHSYVTVTKSGEIFGHAALVPSEDDPAIAEIGIVFVKPKYRGGGSLNRLTTTLIDEAQQKGFAGLFVHAVTTHPYSQKVAHKMGFTDTALLLSSITPLELKKIHEDTAIRESLLHAFHYFNPPAEVRLFAPADHREMIRKIYTDLGVTAVFLQADPAEAPAEQTEYVRTSTDAFAAAHVRIGCFGSQTVDSVHRVLRSLCQHRVETVFLYLPLADPGTAILTPKFEEMNFFFAGVMPGSPGCDRLVLQFLNNAAANYEAMQLDSSAGRALLDYIRSRDPNQRD